MSASPLLGRRLVALRAELAKFGAVGVLSFVVDAGVFNALRLGADTGPITAKVGSVLVAASVAYGANRWWTFRHRARSGVRREYSLFVVLNAVGLGISLTCLYFSHFLLGLTSPLADNASGNVVGLALGTAFRFWSYRRFVFRAPGDSRDHLDLASLAAQSQVDELASASRR